MNLIPPEWKNYATLGCAGMFGGIAAIPSVKIQEWRQGIFYVVTGVVSAIYLSPVVTQHFDINSNASGFLCGSFAGSIIAKTIELIKSIRLQDVLLSFFRRGS